MHLPWNSPQPGHLGPYMSNLPPLYPPVTVANTTTETAIYTVPLPPAFFFQGMDLRIGGMGFHSATGSPKARIRVYKGATLLGDTTSLSSGVSTNQLVELRVHITGQSQTSVWLQGYYNELGGGANYLPMANTSATTINANAENLIVTFTWDTASASDTITWTNIAAYLATPH